MLPLLLIGAGTVIVGYRIGSNITKASEYSNLANEVNAETARIVNEANGNVNESHAEMTAALTTLGNTKKNIMSGNIADVVDVMGRIYKNFKLNRDTEGLKELEEAGFHENMVAEVALIRSNASTLAKVERVDAGDNLSLVSIGVFGGMALMGSILALPALLMYSSSKSDEAKAELYRAASRLDEARYHAEHCENICTLFKAITKRGRQINELLLGLNQYFNPAVAQLKKVTKHHGYNYRGYSDDDRVVTFYTWQIAQTVKTIIDTSMISEDGSLNAEMSSPLEIGQKTLRLLSGAS